MAGLEGLRRPEEVADLRGISIDAVLGLDPNRNAPTAELTAEDGEAPTEGDAAEPVAVGATDAEDAS
jgi:small subunit ribosomal protein S5